MSETSVSENGDDFTTELHYPVFSSKQPALDSSLDSLNKKLIGFISELQDTMKAGAGRLFADMKASGMERPPWVYSLDVRDSVFTATDEFVSFRLIVYQFTGGAHGMTHFYAFNYDLKEGRLLMLEDVLDTKQTHLVDRALQVNFKNPEQCFTVQPELKLVEAVNISADSVHFIFGQYTLGAYACGPAEITVPISDLGDALLLNR